MSWNVFDICCNRLTGATAEILDATAKDSGMFKGQVKIRYQRDERTFYISPEFRTDAQYSSEIIKANRKKSTSLADDDE